MSGARREVTETVRAAAEKAGTLTLAALVLSAAALLVAAAALIVAVKVKHASARG